MTESKNAKCGFKSGNKIAAYIEPVYGCSQKCPSCFGGQKGKNKLGFMSKETFDNILSKLGDRYNLSLYGHGETMIHPQLPELFSDVNLIKHNAIIKTNGDGPIENYKAVLGKIKSLFISLDGSTDAFHKLSRTTSVKDVIEKIKLVQSINDTETEIIIFSLAHKGNYHDLINVTKIARELGLKHHINPYLPFVIGVETPELQLNKEKMMSPMDLKIFHDLYKDMPGVTIQNQRYQKFTGEYSKKAPLFTFDGKIVQCIARRDLDIADNFDSYTEDIQKVLDHNCTGCPAAKWESEVVHRVSPFVKISNDLAKPFEEKVFCNCSHDPR